MEANMREKRSLALYNELKSIWERLKYICTFEERKGIGWWKMGIWRLKGMRGNSDKGICPVYRKERGGSLILQCEDTRVWRDRWLERKFTSLNPDIGIKKIASNKMRDNWTKIAQYLIKYEQKWERAVKKTDERDEKRESDDEIKNVMENSWM
jgi:hypothetical protein